MTVEDQLRAAGRAVSDQVRDLPALDLPPEPAARRARGRTFGRWPGAGRWLIPMAAAATVVAVAVTLVAVRNPPRAVNGANAGPSRSAGPTATSAPVDPEALPGYFVALNGFEVQVPLPPGQSSTSVKNPSPDSVVVGETLTGKRLATIAAPAGSTFVGVTGAADDRTFVLDSVKIAAAQGGLLWAFQQRTWYLLRIRPGADPVQALTPLDFPLPGGADINGVALSPDGTKLAVLYQVAGNRAGFPYNGPFTLRIYSVATGATLHSWTGTDPAHGSYGYGGNGLPDPNANLTWTSDGRRLAFAYRNSNGPSASLYLREVNLASQGGGLFTDSTVVATIAVSTTTGRSKIWCDSLGITGDGRSAVCGAELPRTPPVGATLDALTEPGPWVGCAAPTDVAYPGLAEISLAGDRLTQVLYEAEPKCTGGGYATVLWSSPSGGTVLGVVSYTDDPSMTEHSAIVLYRQGTVTTIGWPGATRMLLANRTAF
jgi:WD40 repeat protein